MTGPRKFRPLRRKVEQKQVRGDNGDIAAAFNDEIGRYWQGLSGP